MAEEIKRQKEEDIFVVIAHGLFVPEGRYDFRQAVYGL